MSYCHVLQWTQTFSFARCAVFMMCVGITIKWRNTMNQEKIDDILEDFKSAANQPILINLYNTTKVLGIEKFFEQDLDGLLKIIQNHVWYCIAPGFPPRFIDLKGFELLHKFALEYEKATEASRNYEKKLTKEFSKKYGMKIVE